MFSHHLSRGLHFFFLISLSSLDLYAYLIFLVRENRKIDNIFPLRLYI